MTSSSRACAHCGRVFPVKDFPKAGGNSRRKDGRHSWCRECKNADLLAWRARNIERVREYNARYKATRTEEQLEAKRAADRAAYQANKQAVRAYTLRKKFGVSVEQYDAMLAQQNGGCAICGRQCSSGRMLAVDHDHLTNRVRGLLCGQCNNGLGRFRDDVELLRKAIVYLT